MNFIEEVELLEEEIKSMESEIISKKLRLIKMLRNRFTSKYSNIVINGKKINNLFFVSLGELIVYEGILEDGAYSYVKINDFWKTLKFSSDYPSKEFINDLKAFNIITGSSKEYYTSKRANGKICKMFRFKNEMVRKLLEEL